MNLLVYDNGTMLKFILAFIYSPKVLFPFQLPQCIAHNLVRALSRGEEVAVKRHVS
jgi:hypothetical protein